MREGEETKRNDGTSRFAFCRASRVFVYCRLALTFLVQTFTSFASAAVTANLNVPGLLVLLVEKRRRRVPREVAEVPNVFWQDAEPGRMQRVHDISKGGDVTTRVQAGVDARENWRGQPPPLCFPQACVRPRCLVRAFVHQLVFRVFPPFLIRIEKGLQFLLFERRREKR